MFLLRLHVVMTHFYPITCCPCTPLWCYPAPLCCERMWENHAQRSARRYYRLIYKKRRDGGGGGGNEEKANGRGDEERENGSGLPLMKASFNQLLKSLLVTVVQKNFQLSVVLLYPTVGWKMNITS